MAGVTVTANVRGAVVPQELLAVTVIVPLFAPAIVETLGIVETAGPVHPAGYVQLYDVAPLTNPIL